MSLAQVLAAPEVTDLGDWPLFGWSDEARPALARALKAGPAALATITAIQGGGPRPIGTQMVLGRGVVDGDLSGGCIEADLALHAQACLSDGVARRLVYARLLCGARTPGPLSRCAGTRPSVTIQPCSPPCAARRRCAPMACPRRP